METKSYTGDYATAHKMMQQMLRMQNDLNLQFVGADWLQQACQRKKINYGTAILEEAQELQACDLSWKWWKSGHPAPDMTNAQVELIDLLHFVMSDALSMKWGERDEGHDERFAIPMEVSDDMVRAWIKVYESESKAPDPIARTSEYNVLQMRQALHQLVASSLQGARVDDFDFEDDDLGPIDSGIARDYTSMSDTDWIAFWSVAYHLGMSLLDIYNTYFGKAALNAFRISKGDKKGEYSRDWGGRQDNYVMMDYLESHFKEFKQTPTLEETLMFMETKYDEYLATQARSLIGAN